MSRLLNSMFVLATLSTVWLAANVVAADEVQIGNSLNEFVAAFNEKNAEKLAACWTETATHTDRETGERTEGRAAIQADFTKVFTAQPGIKLSASMTRAKMVTADVAQVEGQTTVIGGDGVPVESVFSAIMTRSGEKWLFDSIEETTAPIPATPADALQQLEWLIGEWTDESGDVKVRTTFRWSANRAFLLRSFVAESADGNVLEGTQVIGWDANLLQIRSWTFNSDGSFGSSSWSKNENSWMAKSSQTSANGDISSGTYVLEQVDENSFTLQLIGHEINGEPQPASAAATINRVVSSVEVSPSANK
ncbi:MAG: nuclear transport factor 2 family protein [Planctomycetota bacterium]|nr:MAG: nuclear transport factor 2 family protein [Planctomycetota bacterium]